jgi:Anti-sigma factor NepR
MNAGVKLSRGALAAIGRELRAMYANVVAEGVPEQLAEILRRLDESSGAAAKTRSSLDRSPKTPGGRMPYDAAGGSLRN